MLFTENCLNAISQHNDCKECEKMEKKSNIFLRGISERTIALIDQQLHEVNQTRKKTEQLSRNQYIISLLDDRARKPILDFERTSFERQLEANNELLREYIRATNRVLYLITSGKVAEGMSLYDDMSGISDE